MTKFVLILVAAICSTAMAIDIAYESSRTGVRDPITQEITWNPQIVTRYDQQPQDGQMRGQYYAQDTANSYAAQMSQQAGWQNEPAPTYRRDSSNSYTARFRDTILGSPTICFPEPNTYEEAFFCGNTCYRNPESCPTSCSCYPQETLEQRYG